MNEQRPLILVVDDNPDNIQFLGNLLIQKDYEIGIAMNGRDAIKFIDQRLPDLILLDIMMPKMSGFEVCQRLKSSSLTRSIPVIFISAKVETEDIINGLEVGAVDYVKKPFNTSELLLRISTHLELKFNREKLQAEVIKRRNIQEQLEKANKELQLLSNLDGLTKIANRRRFDIAIKEEGERAKRKNSSLSLIMCDVDLFKSYNDTYGHQLGDHCLQSIAIAINNACQRPGDLAARYGGEEFAIVLPNTDIEGALVIAETIAQNIKSLKIEHIGSNIDEFITISMGIATITMTQNVVIETLINDADKALYKAKRSGRNCIIY
jgi:diguanylate cyclase (GGDEF)-like protein